MKPKSRGFLIGVIGIVAVCGATPAFPQAIESPGPGGLFGGQSAAPSPRHNLDLSASVAEAHDSDTGVEFLAVDPLAAVASGFSTMVTGNGAYRWQGSRVQVGATGASNFRYFNQLEEMKSISHTAGVGLSANVSTRTTFALNGTAAYSPAYLYSLFPRTEEGGLGEAIAAAPDYSTYDTESYFYGTSATLTRGLSRRSNLTAEVEFDYTDFVNEDPTLRDVDSRGFRGGYSRNLTRNTVLNAGYRYRAGTFSYGLGADATEVDRLSTEHGIDVGLNYSRPLSATRQFMLAFTLGSSAVGGPIPLDEGLVSGRLYRLSGDATVDFEFAKTWHVHGRFRRGLDYVAQLPGPVFTDGASLEFNGLLTRRLDWRASASYATGQSALNRTSLSFDTYGTDVRLRYALTRSLAAYVQHLYYVYDYRGNTVLFPRLAAGLERNAVRAGVTVWAPLFRK